MKNKLIAFGIVLILLAVGYDTWTQFEHAADNRNRIDQVCTFGKKLAELNKDFVKRQDAQTQGLLDKGITFGIPKAELPKLIAESKASSATQLREYDELAAINCANPTGRKNKHGPSISRKATRKQ